MRIASYNIHAGVGGDGRFAPKRLGAVLQQIDAEVIGLQEVVSVGPDGFALLEALARACGMQAIAGPTMMRGDASYGNALLTRQPVMAVRRLALGVGRFEPRGALAVDLRTGGGTALTVAVTHLGLRRREREAQLERLLAWLPPPPQPLVLMGDFNEWRPWGRVRRRLRERFGQPPAPRTFPARLPLLALDRLLTRPAGLLETLRRERSPSARLASDHLPLVAELNLLSGM